MSEPMTKLEGKTKDGNWVGGECQKRVYNDYDEAMCLIITFRPFGLQILKAQAMASFPR